MARILSADLTKPREDHVNVWSIENGSNWDCCWEGIFASALWQVKLEGTAVELSVGISSEMGVGAARLRPSFAVYENGDLMMDFSQSWIWYLCIIVVDGGADLDVGFVLDVDDIFDTLEHYL